MFNTKVYGKYEQKFDVVGKRLPQGLYQADNNISQGLAKRLHNYALDTLDASGFKESVNGWHATVYTIDCDVKPSDRSYCVKWKNSKGGSLQVVGILTQNGWPFLDHGLSVDS